MALAGAVLAMLLGVVFSGMLARATRVPVPLVQIVLGAAIYYSDLASVDLDPEVFFLVLLPPLLFLDGWRIPKDDLLGDAPTILTLALGLVVFTVLGVGWFIHALVPAIPLPVAFALAAVISPTDPIAVSAIAARTPMPLRMRRILEGESLFNDASGLVCMRFALAAAMTGVFSLGSALLDFAWVALGGVAIGVAATWLLAWVQSWYSPSPRDRGGAQILGSLLIPSAVYLLAESLRCSGILASVAFNPLRDSHLPMLDAQYLFPENVTNIAVRKGHYLRGYAYRFIELCSPGLDELAIRSATNPANGDDEL